MKFLLIIFISFLYSISARANVCWQAVGKPDPNPAYKTKSLCENVQGQECFNICGKQMEFHVVGQVDDLENPIYRPIGESPVQIGCSDIEDCQGKMAGACDGDVGSNAIISKDDSWLSFFGITDPFFIYCQKITGYEQKNALVIDQSLKDAYDAKVAAEQAESQQRSQAKAQRLVDKDACVSSVNASQTMTLPEIKACIDVLVKEVFAEQIPVSDL